MIRTLSGDLYQLPDHLPRTIDAVREWWESTHLEDDTYLSHTVQVMTVDDDPLFHVLVTPYELRIPFKRISPLDPSENALEWREITNTSVIRHLLGLFERDRELPSTIFANPHPLVAEWIMAKNDNEFKYGYPTYGYAGNPDPRVMARMKTMIDREVEAYGFGWDESEFSYPYHHALYLNPSVSMVKADVLKTLKPTPICDPHIRRFCSLLAAFTSEDTEVMREAWTRLVHIMEEYGKWGKLQRMFPVRTRTRSQDAAEVCFLPSMNDPDHFLHHEIWKFRAVHECSDERVVRKCLEKYLETGECPECLANPSSVIVEWLMNSSDPSRFENDWALLNPAQEVVDYVLAHVVDGKAMMKCRGDRNNREEGYLSQLFSGITSFASRLVSFTSTPKRSELVHGTYPSLLYHRHPKVCRLVCEYLYRLPIHSVIRMVEEVVKDEMNISRIHPMVMARLVERMVKECEDVSIRFSLFLSLGYASEDHVMIV